MGITIPCAGPELDQEMHLVKQACVTRKTARTDAVTLAGRFGSALNLTFT